ncbi:MAG: helix-turn-helix transcriptional regulator [Clostridia bacterium]|nr:helix-turn-helix transcriptional regulator [Clostridia bacterium]
MNLNLPELLRRYRKEKNMTQEEVTSRLGVTYQSVSRWENGLSYPDIEFLPSLAALFDVSLDQLFGVDRESEEAKINQYNAKDSELKDNTSERIALVKKYISEIPGCAYFKFRLIQFYHDCGLEFAKKKLNEMRTLCQFIADHTTDKNWYRDLAISYVIDAEEDNKVSEWYHLLDNRSVVTSAQAERRRYDYRKDAENYNRIVQIHLYRTMTDAFYNDFCKRDTKTAHKSAQARVDGQKVVLQIMDAMRDPKTEIDAWIYHREFAYRRLAAGCFGAGFPEDGYAAMEKSVDLCLKLCEIPDETTLAYNTPVLDLTQTVIKQKDVQKLLKEAYASYAKPAGWEWFNRVRHEKRYLFLVSQIENRIID